MTSSSESSASSGCEFGNEEMEEEGLPLLEEGDTKFVWNKKIITIINIKIVTLMQNISIGKS